MDNDIKGQDLFLYKWKEKSHAITNNHFTILKLVLWVTFKGWQMSCFSSVWQSEHFSFLGVNNQANLSDMRCRTTFYTALGRLLMVDLGKGVPKDIAYKHHVKSSGGPLSALTCCVNARLLSAIKKISPLIYSQSWVGSWIYTMQAMMTFTLIF